MKDKIVYKQGFFFPPTGIAVGILCILFALGILFTKDHNAKFISIAIFLILFGLTFFSKKQLHIDKENQVIEEQTNCFGYVFRTKKNLNDFCYIIIIRQLYSITSRSTVNLDLKSRFGKYDVLLTNKPHHYKQKIKSFDNIEDAKSEARIRSDFLNFEIVKFDPVRTRNKHS